MELPSLWTHSYFVSTVGGAPLSAIKQYIENQKNVLGGERVEYSYKFRLYPNREQENLILRTMGCCRFVFNHYLAYRKELYERTGETANYYVCAKDLTILKQQEETTWLREVDATALQSSIRDLDTAYQNFFRRVKKGEKPGYPHFKSKHDRKQSYESKCVGTNIKVLEKAVQLPKLGVVKCRISKRVEGRILSATVSRSASGKCYVSLCCRLDQPYPRCRQPAPSLAWMSALNLLPYLITELSMKIISICANLKRSWLGSNGNCPEKQRAVLTETKPE